ncbi:MAG TPA: glycoside hydrolase family 9 protein [Chitinophagaceae bacterium]|nr:glycoside hydrolase family 9 protein [Chitinophagaceae bacterium]
MKPVACLLFTFILCQTNIVKAQPVIYVNQVGFDADGPKIAVVGVDNILQNNTSFILLNTTTGKRVFTGKLGNAMQVADWATGKIYYRADFSPYKQAGHYAVSVSIGSMSYKSPEFVIERDALAKLTIPSIVHYYNKQRANTPQEIAADSKVKLYGSDKTVDMHGGWCDASGDVSKYFSHLAYANYVSPQQTPLVVWSLANAVDAIPHMLAELHVKDSMVNEALWGADYMMRALSKEDYFYMIIFSYFNKDPNARRVVGLHANSVTTDEYQAAFREGGGMAIAALAKVARWKQHGEYTSEQYLDAAKRAFAHLLVNNTKYDDDGKENIIDDYCALMAAVELWKTTGGNLYRDEARKRAKNLESRMSDAGYFIANNGNRPFWHAADAGLPVIALVQYVKKETDASLRAPALATIKKALDYNLHVTNNTSNPFGYARQSFLYKGNVKDGFFIPHENETGWWWQGEDARLGSLAAAAIEGGRLVYERQNGWGIKDSLAAYASQQLSWILGCNPYEMCFMYGFGKKNVPYMHSNFGHGSEIGGISNGITGKDGNGDGSGIDFKTEAEGNEWRWTEQWIPHAAWFLQAVTAIAEEDD